MRGFERFWSTREPSRVVMEGCSSSHFWARRLIALGSEVKLIPPHYVRPYRRRNKTERCTSGKTMHIRKEGNPPGKRAESIAPQGRAVGPPPG